MMKRATTVLAALLLFTTAGCVDLNVRNPNEPDQARALANPGDVESLIGGSFHTFFGTNDNTRPGGVYNYYGPVMALGTMANRWSSSWGNSGMKDLSSEPRKGIDNHPAYSSAYAIEDGWYPPYAAIKAASDGLKQIAGGLTIVNKNGVDDTKMAEAWGQFVEGVSLGFLAALYDKAFIYDETVDLTTTQLTAQPYTDVLKAALDHLNNAISIAQANQFTIPDSWVNGVTITNTQLVQLAHSYIARYMVETARTPADLAQVDWATVISNVDQGITSDWGPEGDGYNYWEDDLMLLSVDPGWARLDLQMIGMADQSGAYQQWMAAPLNKRLPFLIDTDDRRITGGTPTSDGSMAYYYTTIPFIAGRGYYHFSNYGAYGKWGTSYEDSGGYGPMPVITVAEMQLYKAEGLIAEGNKQAAADIINQTRVADGQLPPVGVDGDQSARCVPRMPDGSCGNLSDALRWEFLLETYAEGAGIYFFNERGWGWIVKDTPLEFPIPGRELQVLQLPYYTFGGPGGEQAAPGGPFGNYVPGGTVGAMSSFQPVTGAYAKEFKASDVIASLTQYTASSRSGPHVRQ